MTSKKNREVWSRAKKDRLFLLFVNWVKVQIMSLICTAIFFTSHFVLLPHKTEDAFFFAMLCLCLLSFFAPFFLLRSAGAKKMQSGGEVVGSKKGRLQHTATLQNDVEEAAPSKKGNRKKLVLNFLSYWIFTNGCFLFNWTYYFK